MLFFVYDPYTLLMGATAMLGHLVYGRYGYGSDGASRRVARMGWLRRVLSALFHRH
ncbi:MAG: hypothetical protein ABSD21_07570 [Rhizomicrobium sp.]|jgi:hypothetical protein